MELIPISLQMDLKHIHTSDDLVQMGMNLKDYYPSGEWDILDVPAERHARIYECCPDEFYAGNHRHASIINHNNKRNGTRQHNYTAAKAAESNDF